MLLVVPSRSCSAWTSPSCSYDFLHPYLNDVVRFSLHGYKAKPKFKTDICYASALRYPISKNNTSTDKILTVSEAVPTEYANDFRWAIKVFSESPLWYKPFKFSVRQAKNANRTYVQITLNTTCRVYPYAHIKYRQTEDALLMTLNAWRLMARCPLLLRRFRKTIAPELPAELSLPYFLGLSYSSQIHGGHRPSLTNGILPFIKPLSAYHDVERYLTDQFVVYTGLVAYSYAILEDDLMRVSNKRNTNIYTIQKNYRFVRGSADRIQQAAIKKFRKLDLVIPDEFRIPVTNKFQATAKALGCIGIRPAIRAGERIPKESQERGKKVSAEHKTYYSGNTLSKARHLFSPVLFKAAYKLGRSQKIRDILLRAYEEARRKREAA